MAILALLTKAKSQPNSSSMRLIAASICAWLVTSSWTNRTPASAPLVSFPCSSSTALLVLDQGPPAEIERALYFTVMAEQPVGKPQAPRGHSRTGAGRLRVTPQGVGQDGHPGRRRRRLSVADLPVGMVLHGRLERPV